MDTYLLYLQCTEHIRSAGLDTVTPRTKLNTILTKWYLIWLNFLGAGWLHGFELDWLALGLTVSCTRHGNLLLQTVSQLRFERRP
jgi:hypothetical protein